MSRDRHETCARCHRWYVDGDSRYCINCLDEHEHWSRLGCGDLGCSRSHYRGVAR